MLDRNVLLPFALPDTKSLRRAAANIIRDIQREHELTDQMFADRIGISAGTVANIRNEKNDIGSVTLARIAAAYGQETLAPFHALYAPPPSDDGEPFALLSDALAALVRAKGLKGELDSLPALKACVEGLSAHILAVERKRLRVAA